MDMCVLISRTLLAVWLCVISVVQAQEGRPQKHLEYRRMDEIQAGVNISVIPDDARFIDHYPSDVLYKFRYDIIKGEHKRYFHVHPVRGTLSVTSFLDRDVICTHQLECDILLDVAIVQPVDYFEVIKVTLTLIDVNDNDPAFPELETTLHLSENAAPPVSFVLPSAIDPDSGLNTIQSYDIITDSTAFGLLTTNDGLGISDVRLELRERLNREEESSYEVYIVAKDGGDPARSGTMTVHIQVVDANDNSPTFEFSLYNVSLKEDHPLGVPFLQVKATDVDQGVNGLVTYGISPQVPSLTNERIFTINNMSGEISLLRHLDYETQTTFHLLVSARDMGPDSVPVHAKVIVHLEDVNDFVPEIHVKTWTDTGHFEVLENADPGTFVAHVSVDDQDLGLSGKVTCHVTDTRFKLQWMYGNTYKLVTVVSLDREQENRTTVTVQCEDMGEMSLSASMDIPVYIKDMNDHKPVFTRPIYKASVPENSAIGCSILTVSAKDRDVGLNARITYHLHANSNNLFRVGSDSGIVTTNSKLDYERVTDMEFYILAIDKGDEEFTATATVSLTVTDVNDEAPVFRQNSYNFAIYENQQPGTELGRVVAQDKDAPPNDEFRFSIRDTTAFSIDSDTGIITTKKVLDREHQPAYYLDVVATDVQPPHLSGTVTVTVYVTDKNDNAPTIDYPNTTNQTVEVSGFSPKGFIVYRVQAHDADQAGDHAKLTYSIAKGNEGHLFKMDPNRGIISVAADLTQVTKDLHNLMIKVQDHGDDFKYAVASLVVQINRTQAFADNQEMLFINPGTDVTTSETDATARRFRSQDVILIILGAITVVLVSILITAIVCIKKRQRHRDRDSYKYMCRIDLANQLSSLQHDRQDEGDGSRRQSTGSADDDMEKSQFTQFDPRDSGIQAPSVSGSFSDVSNGSHVALQIALANGGAPIEKADRKSHRNITNAHAQGYQDYPTQTWPLVEKPVQVPTHTLLPAERDSDSTSGCSADMSNPDSGRGHHGSDTRLANHSHHSGHSNYHTNVKTCPTHGKNVTFGDVTCHSPTRSREYVACPLRQCDVNHVAQRQLKSGNRVATSPHGTYDNRTGCHGGTSTGNNHQKAQYTTPPNGRIHPQPQVVLSTFGYDDAPTRRQHHREPASPSEARSLIMDPNIAQSIV